MVSEKIHNKILPQRQQVNIRNQWLAKRLEQILPQIMRETGIDLWIIIGREFNEDPIMFSMFPATVQNASRLTGLIFSLDDNGLLDCLNLYSNKSGALLPFYKPVWNKGFETQWECLSRIVREKDPLRIGLNFSENYALVDGISSVLYQNVLDAIGAGYASRVVSAEHLGVRWLETRLTEELDAYPGINNIMDSVIDEMFSSATIHPGVTTTTDVEWRFIETIKQLGLSINFKPDVDLQRRGLSDTKIGETLILPGDLLRCDVGLQYLGLNTDTQKMAYVLKRGEKSAPDGMRKALENCHKFQDIVCRNLRDGKTGNQVFSDSKQEASQAGIQADLYAHPIGFHVHGAGPIIGLWDQQGFIPGRGELPIRHNTCYALELFTRQYLPEWNQDINIFLEQLIAYHDNQVVYLGKREEEFLLIS